VRGAGRTDAGVHARGQVAAVRLTEVPADLGKLQKSLNALTPDDVGRARDRGRRRRVRSPPPRAEPGLRVPHPERGCAVAVLAPARVARAASARRRGDETAAGVLEGEHDFAAFRAADAEVVRSTVRRAFVSRVDREDELLVYRIEATAFLKHMVRNIVGTLVEVGSGVAAGRDLAAVLESRDRGRAGPTAPPHGLCLVAVRY
jgi:tRNA pseudouridine38-40 synthase